MEESIPEELNKSAQKKIINQLYLNSIRNPILSTTLENNETAYTAIKQQGRRFVRSPTDGRNVSWTR
jgi:hypothetical protein